MAHPHKSEVKGSHNAKLQRMTRHYGLASGPANNIRSPQEALKSEGPEPDVGFGADSAMMTPRSDRPARRSMAANPVPTYATGGAVKGRDQGGVIARARGGRANKGATHVNVIIAPPQGAAPPAGPSPQLAALAGGPAAPPAPPMPPPAPPMMPPPGPGGPPMMRARGGRTKLADEVGLDDDKRNLIEDTLKEEGLIKRARGGGIHMTAGAVTGIGRLEKMGIKARHRGSMAPKEI